MNEFINFFDAVKLSANFVGAKPFDHIVIDDFLNNEFALELSRNFPSSSQKTWWMYDNPLEKKLAFNNISELHDSFNSFFDCVNSTKFLKFLEMLTGLDDLKADISLNGGGLHLIKRGGKLDVHEDFNINKQIKMLRKVNLILYLNEGWKDEWGGHLELWDKDMKVLHHKILPMFNRAVIFRTDMQSNHGHPHPLMCPEDRARISLATYYYQTCENIDSIPHKSTVYKKLPGSDDGLDELRMVRSKGRIQDLKTKK
jgi:Rps23 Pro-64 3,4-dihydroxylase Tpa1-like proline 4-hydroxylase